MDNNSGQRPTWQLVAEWCVDKQRTARLPAYNKNAPRRILIIQPGAFGDIVICLPIAGYYARQGYKVDWLCHPRYHIMFRHIDYCRPVTEIAEQYYDVLDISFGYFGAPQLWWYLTQYRWKSFVEAKYHLARVPLEERYKLAWKRDRTREDEVYDRVVSRTPYVLAHDEASSGKLISLDFENAVKFRALDDYNVFDWYKVVLNASEIHCIDSLLCNFVEAVSDFDNIPKFFYPANRHNKGNPLFTLLQKQWTVIES